MKDHGRLFLAVFAVIALFLGCQSTGDSADPEPDVPDRPDAAEGVEPIPNLLSDPEKRKLYLDLDNYTQRWLAARNEGRTRAEESLAGTVITPLVDENLDELLSQIESSDNHPRRITAARAVGFTTRQSEVIPVIMPKLDVPDANLVSSLLVSLWLMANPDTPVAPLVDLLGHPDEDIRNNDAMALSAILRARSLAGGGMPSDEMKRASGKLVFLVSNLDEDEFVRAHAASALGAIGDPAAVDVLINLLGDDSSAVRTRAAEGLGQLGQAQAIPPLIQALTGRRAPLETQLIIAALEKIARKNGYPVNTKALGVEPENWRGWYTAIQNP